MKGPVRSLRSSVAFTLAVAQAGLWWPALASAADPRSATALEEVVVTSRRVAERLQDTPIAVSAFQAADLAKLNVTRVGDVAAFTPNFVSGSGPTGGNDGYFFVRGVGQTDPNPATDPAVGTYVDGVYIGRNIGTSMNAADIARIEVLRGPQGTLFGRNTIGGAVNITTADPGDEFGVDAMVGVGSRDLIEVRGAVDVPFSPEMGLRVSGHYRNEDGWGRRLDGTTLDDNDSRGGRAKFKWQATEDFGVVIAGDYTKLTGSQQHTQLIGVNPQVSGFRPFTPLGVPLPPALATYVNPAVDSDRNQSAAPILKDYEMKGASLTLDWRLGSLGVKSITAWRGVEQAAGNDFDSSPLSVYDGAFVTDQTQLSQEFQLSGETERLRWLLGAFYYDENIDHTNRISLGGNNGCLPFPIAPPPGGFAYPVCGPAPYITPGVARSIVNNQVIALDVQAIALFAHATVQLAPTWSASLGLRWTDEEKDQSYDFFINNTARVANAPGFPPAIIPTLSPNNPRNTTPTRYQKSWSEVTPKAGLEWKPEDGRLYYVSYSRGFKSGGFNGRPNPTPTGAFAPIQPYDPEKMDSYELGAKLEFADGRYRMNAAVFQSDYKGIQLLSLGSSGFFETVNAAESRIRGVELELQARPIPDLLAQASVGYLDDEFTELDPNVCRVSGICFGNTLPLTPELSGSLGLQYGFDVGTGRLTARGDWTYRGEVFYSAVNRQLERQGGFGLVNARVTYEFDAWSVAFYGTNLADKRYFTNMQDVRAALGVAFAGTNAPRSWGVELRTRFGGAK